MDTARSIAQRLVDLAGDSWTTDPESENVIVRPRTWSDPRFAPNITVLPVDAAPLLDVPSTAVQLAGSLDQSPPVVLHQLVVDVYDGVAVTHETVWLDTADGPRIAVTSSASGHDVAVVARVMAAWQLTIRRSGDE